jgi:hypothetical protein
MVIMVVFLLLLTIECKKTETAKLQVFTTMPVTSFTTITERSGGNIRRARNISNGVCWSIALNLVITDSKTVDAFCSYSYIKRYLILLLQIRKINLLLPLIPTGNRSIFQFAPFRVGVNKLKIVVKCNLSK